MAKNAKTGRSNAGATLWFDMPEVICPECDLLLRAARAATEEHCRLANTAAAWAHGPHRKTYERASIHARASYIKAVDGWKAYTDHFERHRCCLTA